MDPSWAYNPLSHSGNSHDFLTRHVSLSRHTHTELWPFSCLYKEILYIGRVNKRKLLM